MIERLYAPKLLAVLFIAAAIRAYSQGRSTSRDRTLHHRTFLLTGAFTPTGLTLLQALASRGAKIIALSHDPIDDPAVTALVSLLRTTHSNDHIYAEQCDLHDPAQVRHFCTRFLTEGEADADKRLDGIIFAHEYQHLRVPQDDHLRNSGALATFLIITLLFPLLLTAPVERDIRIINVVNPFYAAAAAATNTTPFDPTFQQPTSSRRILLTEGHRSLRTIILTRHLQRVLDALPKPQVPKTEDGSSTVPIISPRMQRSNIVAVSVSPGISRVDTVSRFLNADWSSVIQGHQRSYSWMGIFFYILLLPFLHIFTKSPTSTIQSILHALFLPTPFKILAQSTDTSDQSLFLREEVLKPGALYAECAVVKLNVVVPTAPSEEDSTSSQEKTGLGEDVLQMEDDGEYGGELAGRLAWEAYEAALKVWEKDSKK